MNSLLKKILIVISAIGLAFTFVPSVLSFKGIITMENHFMFMLIGTVLWFATAPFWMKTKSLDDE